MVSLDSIHPCYHSSLLRGGFRSTFVRRIVQLFVRLFVKLRTTWLSDESKARNPKHIVTSHVVLEHIGVRWSSEHSSARKSALEQLT